MTTTAGRTRLLLLAGVLILGEALAALAFGVLQASAISPDRAGLGIGVTVLMLGAGLLLVLVARGVARARRWSRGLAVATQLMLLLLAYSFRPPPTTGVGLVMGLVALTALVCLLAPPSTQAFLAEDPPAPGGPAR